jgi:transposase
MSLKLLLKTYVVNIDFMSVRELNWTMLEKEVAASLHVRREHVTDIRKQYFDDGDILDKKAEGKMKNGSYEKKVLNTEQLRAIIEEVDARHAEGKAVTNRLMRTFVIEKYKIEICRTTMGNYFRVLGLSYKPIKSKKRNVGAYRMDLLSDFLIKFSEKYVQWLATPDGCPFILACVY